MINGENLKDVLGVLIGLLDQLNARLVVIEDKLGIEREKADD